MQTTVNMLVDYEGPLSRQVAGEVWGGISRVALESGVEHTRGYAKTTATWDSLREPPEARGLEAPVRIFVIQQDLPDTVDALGELTGVEPLCGLVLAVPEHPSPLAASLLQQGVERLREGGVGSESIESGLVRADPDECKRYAERLLGRLKVR